MFRMVESPSIEKVNKALSIGENKGRFEFSIEEEKDSGNSIESLQIDIERNKEPILSIKTKYIFHVFNSDYIKENIEAVGFLPDGEIEGYILGKSKIDLTKEKKKFESLKKEIDQKGQIFKKAVDKGKLALDELKVNKNTSEYKFDYKDVYENRFDYKDKKTFEELKIINTMLGKMPDDLEDVLNPSTIPDLSVLDSLKVLFSTKYTKSSFAEEFKNKINAKDLFINEGIQVIGKNKNDWSDCPFCEQNLTNSAIKLIDNYINFINDEESKIKRKIDDTIADLNAIDINLIKGVSMLAASMKKFDNNKQYIPSQMKDDLLEYKVKTDFDKAAQDLTGFLIRKKDNIGEEIDSSTYTKSIDVIKSYVDGISKISEINIEKIAQLNENKKNTNNEKRELNRRLCRAMYQGLRNNQSYSIEEISKLTANKKTLGLEIEKKESQEKVKKKDKVVESLKIYLNFFFREKYEFDEENFCLRFNTHLMNNDASDILSDGEKSIVAFCYYLADIHKIVSKEGDYNKLFFIIDDPISSLDFHFVYSVAHIIRGLNEDLNMIKNRFLVMTHNLEFMSILIRNKIATDYFTLSNGEIIKLKNELVMPYEEHLRDILNVSKGVSPTHTTPNSIRHVLETIYRFEAPNKDLKKYINENKVLEKNEFIYSLMHDSSHGIVRSQKPYTDEMIKNGCEVVVDFINSKFEGQIKQLS